MTSLRRLHPLRPIVPGYGHIAFEVDDVLAAQNEVLNASSDLGGKGDRLVRANGHLGDPLLPEAEVAAGRTGIDVWLDSVCDGRKTAVVFSLT